MSSVCVHFILPGTRQIQMFYIDFYQVYTGWPKKNGTVETVDISGLCSDQQLSFSPCWIEHLFFIIITPRSSNLVENFLFYEYLSYGLSFSGFARFPEFRGTINDKLMANPENDSPQEITHKIKSFQPNLMILVLFMRKRCSIQQGEKG